MSILTNERLATQLVLPCVDRVGNDSFSDKINNNCQVINLAHVFKHAKAVLKLVKRDSLLHIPPTPLVDNHLALSSLRVGSH
jgi:hypothetical protein